MKADLNWPPKFWSNQDDDYWDDDDDDDDDEMTNDWYKKIKANETEREREVRKGRIIQDDLKRSWREETYADEVQRFEDENWLREHEDEDY